MRWLSNIAFSSSSSSDQHRQGGGGRSRLFNIRRSRRQSDLSSEDVTVSSSSSTSFGGAESALDCRSSSVPRNSEDKSRPRPHPLPLPKNNSGSGSSEGGGDDCPLPSPDDLGRSSGGGDDFDDGDIALSPLSRACGHQERRKSDEQVDLKFSRSGHQEYVSNGSSRDKFSVNIPVASAPVSPLTSPVHSPGPTRRVFCETAPIRNHAWSALEKYVSDSMPGVTCTSQFSHISYSNECSPLHSPVARSPYRNKSAVTSPVHPVLSFGHDNNDSSNFRLLFQSPPTGSPCKSPNSGPASPVHPNLSSGHDGYNHANARLFIPSPPTRSPCRSPKSGPASPVHSNLSSRLESFNRCIVHPLPLPPGATLPSPSAASTKSDSMPMQKQWQKGKLIGRGTFGSVYVATNRETGALCAMKEVEVCPDDPKSAECVKQLEQEIKVLSQLEHPNIVQYYGSETIDDKFYIYLEFVHPGSINKYVRENCGAITESIVRSFTRHILTGLAYLHSKKAVHRDIKGANLLVDSCGVVKLADFGMAKHLNGQMADLSLKGSPYWMAPELMQSVMQKDKRSDLAFAVDIWSLGCTIIEMLTGKPPWSEFEGAAAMFKVMRDTPPIPDTLSPEGKDFLQLCFIRNPAERPPANTLLEHPFVRGSLQTDGPLVDQASYKYIPGEQCRYRFDDVPTPSSAQHMGLRHSPRSTLDALPCLSLKDCNSTNE